MPLAKNHTYTLYRDLHPDYDLTHKKGTSLEILFVGDSSVCYYVVGESPRVMRECDKFDLLAALQGKPYQRKRPVK